MSRTYRRFGGTIMTCGPGSMKWWRRTQHKIDRQRTRIAIIHGRYIDAEIEFRGDIWCSPSDGYIMVTDGIGPYKVTPEGSPQGFMKLHFEWYYSTR